MDVDVTEDILPTKCIVMEPFAVPLTCFVDDEGWFVINVFNGEIHEGKHDVIYLEKPSEGATEGPTAKCTCGEWEYGPSVKLVILAVAAKQHADETGHRLRGT